MGTMGTTKKRRQRNKTKKNNSIMNYIIADMGMAKARGLRTMGHKARAGLMVFNERELLNCQALTGTLRERAALINGKVYTEAEVKSKMNEGGWKYE